MRHHGVPESVIDDNEGFWDFIRDTSEAYAHDVVLADGDVVRAGGRDLRVVARPGPQHDRRAVRRRARAHRLRRRSPAGRDLVQHRGRTRRLEPDRIAPAGAGRVPREPAPDGRDAARPAADRARRRRSPTTSISCAARLRRPRPALRAHRRRARATAPPARTGSPRTCGRRGRSPSSRCSSSGRCSGTSTCCSTRARVDGAGDRRRQHATATRRSRSPSDRAPRRRPGGRDVHPRPRRSSPDDSDDAPRAGRRRDARDRFDLTGRVAVVTGGTRGLGLAMARGFAPGRRRGRRRQPQAGRLRRGRRRAARRGRQGGRLRLPRRPLGRARGARRGRLPRLRPRRRARQQRRRLADVRASSPTSPRSCSTRSIARQPQGAVPARGARRRADGRGRRRLDHQRLEHRRGAADARHRPVRGRQGRRQRDDRRARARVRADRARQRDHARARS